MDIELRKMKATDWPAVKKLSEEFRDYNLKLVKKFDNSHAFFELPFTKNNFLKILRRKDKYYVLALADGRVVGFAYAQTAPCKFNKSKSVGYLSDIFITKSYRGKGVANMIWDELLGWFKSKKVSFLQLNVFFNNEHAIKVYKRWGFKPYTMMMSQKF